MFNNKKGAKLFNVDIPIGLFAISLIIFTDISVISRKIGVPIIYTLELSKVLYAWAVWVSIYWVVKKDKHIKMELVSDKIKQKNTKYFYKLVKIVQYINLAYFISVVVFALQFTLIYIDKGVTFLAMPSVPYAIFPLAMVGGGIPSIIWIITKEIFSKPGQKSIQDGR